jgi:hypothetical protein
MEEYERLDYEVFELKWSTNGVLLPSHSIIRELRSGRRKQDEELAAAAKRDYPGELFDKFFSYNRNGRRQLITDTQAIAKRYLRLREEARHISN